MKKTPTYSIEAPVLIVVFLAILMVLGILGAVYGFAHHIIHNAATLALLSDSFASAATIAAIAHP